MANLRVCIILCLICSKKDSEKSSGKGKERDEGPDTVKGGSVVLSKNVLDDGTLLIYLYLYGYSPTHNSIKLFFVYLKRHARTYMHSTFIFTWT